jgi:hypothetical protein
MNNIRCETNRTPTNQRREYLKDKLNEMETNSKNKNIRDSYRGINEFKGYQPRPNLSKDKSGNVLTDSHNFKHMDEIHSQMMILGTQKYIQLGH